MCASAVSFDEIDSPVTARRDALDTLFLSIIHGSLRPLGRKEVLRQADRLLGEAWSDVTARELERALDELDLDGIETDHSGRYYASVMATDFQSLLPHLAEAAAAVSALEDTEGGDADSLKNRQVTRLYQRPLLDPREEYILAVRAARGRIARNELIEANTRLARSVSGPRTHSAAAALDDDDLFQEACLGLIRAAEKFEPSRGFRFSTYATWWLRQSVSRAVADKSRTIRFPVHIHERLEKIRVSRRRLEIAGHAAPNVRDLAQAAGLEVAQVSELLVTERVTCVPLDDLTSEVEAGLVARDAVPIEELVVERFSDRDVDILLSCLPERQRQVLRLRLGLDGEAPTLEEVGALIGVTRERVRQIESDGLKRLRSISSLQGPRRQAA